MKVLQKGKEGALLWLFPRRCPVCDKIVTPRREKICAGCMKKLEPVRAPWCIRCGKTIADGEKLCKDCRMGEHYFVRGRSVYQYGSVSEAIYRFKYGGRQEYAEFFGEEMAFFLREFIRNVKPDALVPVPLHKKRQNRRGYNQAALLARVVGRYTGIPVYEDYLVRVRNTRPLKEQNPKERQNNLKNAFNIGQNDVKLNTIIVVDDIYTTGSTIDEAAYTLLRSGVQKVYFLALACGEG